MAKKVYPVPYGTKDILPGEMRNRRIIENSIVGIFEKWGYDEVKTPDFEYAETLGNTQGDFRFFDRTNKMLVLRNDMTAPIARLASTRLEGGAKVKRLCYLANLYRYEEIQAGRQCEFEQAGVELLGAKGAAADAEIIVLAAEALKTAGLEQFAISLGHVDFINGLAEEAGMTEEQIRQLKDCLRKHDAVGLQEIADELSEVSEETRQLFADFLFLQGGKELLIRAGNIVTNEKCLKAIKDLEEIYDLLEVYGVAQYLSFDLGLYRSLDYYTGMLFEVYLPEMGYPVAGGGRYDNMMEDFGVNAAATGFAVGVDRVMLALERSGKLDNRCSCEVLVAWSSGKLPEAIKKAAELRAEGKSVKLCTGSMTVTAAETEQKLNGCAALVYIE